jgi:hypothetical protein
MSTTGYYSMAFTEINPTSTLTTIDLWYDKEWTGNGHWVIGPFQLIQNDALPQTPDTITPPPTLSPVATATVTATVMASSGSTTSRSLPCESLFGLLLLVVICCLYSF